MATKPLAVGGSPLTAQDQADVREQIGAVALTTAQTTAGATGVAALTAAGVALDAAGAPLATISRAERDLPVRVATLGTSLSLVAPTYANSSLSPFQAVMPAGATTNQYQTEGFALGMFYPQARVVAQGGIGGQTLAQMLARDTLSASATRYSAGDILAQSPDVVLLHLPTNDLATVTAGTYTAVLDAAKTSATALIARILASNARVCDYGCPGYSAANANLALIRQAVVEWNAWCRSTLTATFGAQGYAFIDPLNVTHDATGAYLPGISYDGIHLGGGGKIALARPTAAQLTAWYGQPAKGVFEGNWISNATLANQEANSWGTQAVGFGITAASGTKSNSVVSTQNGVTTQSIEVRGLVNWQPVFMAIPCDLTSTATGMTGNLALTSDEFVQVECDVTITSLGAAPVAFNTVDVTVTLTGAAGGTVLIQQAIDATVMPSGTSTVTLHLATPDVAAMGQGGFTASAARVSVYAATACPDIKVGISAPKLTKTRRPATGALRDDSGAVTLRPQHANTQARAAASTAYTVDASTLWTPSDGQAVWLPATGSVTFAVSGGPTLNGGTSTLTRTLASNPVGYVVLNRVAGAAAYSLSGA